MRSDRRWETSLLMVVLGGLVAAVVGGCGSQGAGPTYNEARYEDPNYAPKTDLDGDVPQATLGGYVFGTNSHRLTHPMVSLQETSAGWVFRGWGVDRRRNMFVDVCYGGTVRKVKTLRVRRIGTGSEENYEDMLLWLAQDTAGNVHYLKQRILASAGGGGALPAERVGVTAGDPAWFLLPASPTVGQTWYHEGSSQPGERFRVLSDTASFHGHTGLLKVQRVADGDGDGRYSPAWDGPDGREDWFFETGTGMLNTTIHSLPAGGLERFE
jgi:hypothetical protein